MNPATFIPFSLGSLCLLLLVYAEVIKEYRSSRNVESVVETLQYEVAQERLKAKVLSDEYSSFKREVAEVLPEFVERFKGDFERAYPVRNLASLMLTSQPLYALDSPRDRLLEASKGHFKEGDYEAAARRLEEFVEKYETSSRVVEAKFLLAESYFQNKDFEKSMTVINEMLNLYPDNDLTGFLLLRLGAIFESQHKSQEAHTIYQTILTTFDNKDLTFQAERNLQRLVL